MSRQNSDDNLSSYDDFFKQSDFKFASDSEDSLNDNPDENSFSLALQNKITHQGGFFLGIVKLHIGNRLPMGKIILRLKTSLSIKCDEDLEDNSEGIIEKY